MKKSLFFLTVTILILCMLVGCTAKITNKSLQKPLENSREYSHLDPLSISLISDSKINGNSTAVLFSGKSSEGSGTIYYIGILDSAKENIRPINISYMPLEFLQKEILENRTQRINVSYFEKMSEYLSDKGEDCLEDEDTAIEFLRLITSDDGIISTNTAQRIISDMATEELFSDKNDFFAIFEDGSANPICYGVSDTNDAYTDGKAWIAYDVNGRSLGVYNSKSELYTEYTGKEADFPEDEKPKEILKFATVSNNEPFAYRNGNDLIGTDIEIARALALELDMELEISTMTADAAIRGTEDGTYHMSMGGYTSETKSKNIRFTDNYYNDYVIMLSNIDTEIGDKICIALNTLKSNGTIDSIINSYTHGEELVYENKPNDKIEIIVEDMPELLSEDADSESDQETENEQEVEAKYLVRKSADDRFSQFGAYSNLANARRAADNNKNLGYKVYDTNGNLVYAP